MTLKWKSRSKLIYFLFFLFLVFVLFKPPSDPDFGWHYKYGEYLFKNHTLLKENIFSYNFPYYQWANSYWLSQIVMYVLFTYIGAVGMSLFLSVLLAAIVVCLIRTLKLSLFGEFLGVFMLGVFLSAYIVTVRPLYFSSVFFLILSYILVYKSSYIKFLPLLFLMWANMHADFVLGLFVYGVFTVFMILNTWREQEFSRENFYVYVIAPIASVLVTLINPYGIRLWETLLKEVHPYQFAHVSEWVPLSVGNITFFSVYVFTLVLVFSSIWIKRAEFGKWYLFVVGIFTVLAFVSKYFIRPLVLVGVFPVLFFYDVQGRLLVGSLGEVIRRKLERFGLALVWFVVFVSLTLFTDRISVADDVRKWSGDSFPYDAVEYVKKNPIVGRMLNNYGWGGYLIWRLPEYKTFIDGRMPSWREGEYSVFEDYINVTNNPEQYAYLLDLYDVSFILDKKNSKLVEYLLQEDLWWKVYEDNLSVIVVKGAQI